MVSSIDNAGNSPAFKAKLVIETTVKDSARLKGIQRMFSEKTQNMKDILTVSSRIEEYDNRECFYAGKKYENSIAAFLPNSVDEMMEKLSDTDIVTKLVKVLESIKLLNKRESIFESRQGELSRLEGEQQRNLLIAKNCRARGSVTMAERFETLAGIFGKKIDRLEAEQTEFDANILGKIDKIANGDSEITSIKGQIF